MGGICVVKIVREVNDTEIAYVIELTNWHSVQFATRRVAQQVECHVAHDLGAPVEISQDFSRVCESREKFLSQGFRQRLARTYPEF